ncbi:MAG: hypothetical protein ACP5NX_01670 [Candidatus Bilamarchaeaceae archaeon]
MQSKRDMFMKKAKTGTAEMLKSRDTVLANVSRSVDEITYVINVLNEKLEEWLMLYIPRLKFADREKYAQLALLLGKGMEMKELSKLCGSATANEIGNAVSKGDLKDDEAEELKRFAWNIKSLYELKQEYENYTERLAKELCPNICEVAGADIAAKLVAHTGSVKRIAMFPASTIQIMGAEKALFKHLKNRRVPPPKHGIIFQHQRISMSPKRVRGKIARTLANKICLAAKADAYTHNFIAKELKESFDKRYEQIMAQYERTKDKPRPSKPAPDYPPKTAGFAPKREEGYPPRAPPQQGGYGQREHGGFQPKREGSYPPRRESGYPPRREGGYGRERREGGHGERRGYGNREGGGQNERRGNHGSARRGFRPRR